MARDTAINNNAIAVILNYSGFQILRDVTHLGIFINSIYSNIPNVRVLAPTNKAEYLAMISYAIYQNDHPTIVLMPGNGVIDDGRMADKNYSEVKFKTEIAGEKVALIALGDFYQLGENFVQEIQKKLGFTPTLINPRFASDIDTETLDKLKENHKLVITLEDGIVEGGFGVKVANYLSDSDLKVKVLGFEKKFFDRYNPDEFLKDQGITAENILELCSKI